MTRLVIDVERFQALVRGEAIVTNGADHVVISPPMGWIKMVRAILDAVAPLDPPVAASQQRKQPPDPPQAREFLPPRNQRR